MDSGPGISAALPVSSAGPAYGEPGLALLGDRLDLERGVHGDVGNGLGTGGGAHGRGRDGRCHIGVAGQCDRWRRAGGGVLGHGEWRKAQGRGQDGTNVTYHDVW